MIEETTAKTNSIGDNKSTTTETRNRTRRKFSFKVNLKKSTKSDKNNEINQEKQDENSVESSENQTKSKLTIKRLFRKSSIKKLITNVQKRVLPFTVSTKFHKFAIYRSNFV